MHRRKRRRASARDRFLTSLASYLGLSALLMLGFMLNLASWL